MNDFNNTIVPYPKEKTIFGLFEEQVAKNPSAIAIEKGLNKITYTDLNKLANRLANLLVTKGVMPQDNVGLLVTRDFDMIIGMMAIMKAGAAYVPIDPEYPVDRQLYIFNQSKLKLVIANNDYPLKSTISTECFLKINFLDPGELNESNPPVNVASTQLAYTIYTSGSTGRPKGVMIEHHSVVNLILWVNTKFNVGPHDRLLFITSMCFDLSVYDIFGMLAAGGTIVIAENKEIQDVRMLQNLMIDYQVTFWDSVPTTLDYLVANLEQERPDYKHEGLKTIFLSGDWIPIDLPTRTKKFFPQAQFVSLGGATEGTIWSNFYIVEQVYPEWRSIPYGKPIYNNFFYILDEQLKPVPTGEPGDLYIGGVGVARGYANDAEKTNAAFIPDPFNSQLGGMMYRTGDTGRMMPDFNMEFLGRKDSQVKINGFRVELGEIESVLNKSELVRSCVVLAKKGPDGNKRLIGYVVPKATFEKETVTAYLKTKLPDYMIPAVWVEMDKMPLNSNGKIDRNALPEFTDTLLQRKRLLQPITPTEKILTSIWKECMGLNEISIDDNFFALGGHSLMAVQILSKLEKKLGRSFQLAVLFKYPNIQLLANFIDNDKKETTYTCLVPIKSTGNKTPLYIIHGEGLNVLNFSSLAAVMDKDRPIFGLQAVGLNGIDEPLDNLPDIAKFYLSEIIRHNPTGPYLLAGYSFGGYVALEIRKQMAAMGKKVEKLIMFDTDAEKSEYKDWYYILPKKVKRNVPILLSFLKSSILHPITNFRKKYKNPEPGFLSKYFLKKETKNFYQLIKKIKDKHLYAFRNYKMEPFDGKVYLYKAQICVHYVYDTEFLGWKKYALGGVVRYDVPGDHLTMITPPNVEAFAAILSASLDEKEETIQTTEMADTTAGIKTLV
ncbi:non-ribosomal peptide synthetase [Mucilaginibacter boryungensis]|uniref:Amino acid adenylation domain-containing protein n=1 Tax=Mucilaginibacter boryungensis TaxID=768480 RepID=A0ABR9XHF0_9SPHI|nr:amino acid adenylation domain-containing protein [Mucilaginibacter boryungensis]MBE9666813.1 amino acid adenylation domain-containing protein [Mucilaginibacter boryungensis]